LQGVGQKQESASGKESERKKTPKEKGRTTGDEDVLLWIVLQTWRLHAAARSNKVVGAESLAVVGNLKPQSSIGSNDRGIMYDCLLRDDYSATSITMTPHLTLIHVDGTFRSLIHA